MDVIPELQRTYIRISRELAPLVEQLEALTKEVTEKKAALEHLKDHAPAAAPTQAAPAAAPAPEAK